MTIRGAWHARFIAAALAAMTLGAAATAAGAPKDNAQTKLLRAKAANYKIDRPAVNRPPMVPSGIPALNLKETSHKVISRQDVLDYVGKHPIPRIASVGEAPVVTLVDCGQTGKSASVLLRGKPTGLADATPVCYVQLKGQFAISFPRGQISSHEPIFTKAILLFHAETGNLLLSAAMKATPSDP